MSGSGRLEMETYASTDNSIAAFGAWIHMRPYTELTKANIFEHSHRGNIATVYFCLATSRAAEMYYRCMGSKLTRKR